MLQNNAGSGGGAGVRLPGNNPGSDSESEYSGSTYTDSEDTPPRQAAQQPQTKAQPGAGATPSSANKATAQKPAAAAAAAGPQQKGPGPANRSTAEGGAPAAAAGSDAADPKKQQQQKQQPQKGAKGKEAAKQQKQDKKKADNKNKPPSKSILSPLTHPSGDAQRVTVYLFFLIALLHLLFVILSCTLSQLDKAEGGCITYWGYKADCDTVSYTNRTQLLSCKALVPRLQAAAGFSILSVLTSAAVVVTAWLLVSRMRHALWVRRRKAQYTSLDDAEMKAADTQQQQGNPSAASPDTTAAAAADKQAQQGNKNNKKDNLIDAGSLKWKAVAMMGVSLVLELICWAIIAAIYSTRPCEDKEDPRVFTYGVGFGLGITAFIIEIITMVGVAVVV